VAKTLYATKWARPNTCTAIEFLMTRVQAPNKDDWSKLVHLMKYPSGTCTLPLILSANGSNQYFEVVSGCSICSPSQNART
jgi:hypothetical protein